MKEIERLIMSYLWAGQKVSAHSRVALVVLFCTKNEGGVGLISLVA